MQTVDPASDTERTAQEPPSGRADRRARARLRALRQAVEFATHRAQICRESADAYAVKYPDDKMWALTERCASGEARLIAETITRFIEEAERKP